MAVVWIREHFSGRGGESEGLETHTQRTFLVRTSDPADNEYTITAAGLLPTYLAQHPSNAFLLCRKLSIRPEGKGATLWKAVADYSTEKVSEQEQEQRQTPDPLDRAARIRWRSTAASVVCAEDIDGAPILNSAGDAFDPPPEKLSSYWVAEVTKNLSAVPSWLLAYRDAVNDADFTIDGLPVQAGQARIASIEIGEWQKENGVSYRAVSLSIEFQASWELKLLDAGLHEFVRGKKVRAINAGDGSPTAGPVLLDGDGARLADAADPVFLSFTVYPQGDFSVLPLT